MSRFYWTLVVASRAHVFYPPATREAPWSRIVLAFVWTNGYLCICGLWTLLRSQRGLLVPRTKQMTFWKIGVGLRSMAHFVYNSGGSRGGAREAQAPLLFLDQTEVAPERPKQIFWRPPHPPYLRVWMTGCPPLALSAGLDPPLYNNIATTHLCL